MEAHDTERILTFPHPVTLPEDGQSVARLVKASTGVVQHEQWMDGTCCFVLTFDDGAEVAIRSHPDNGVTGVLEFAVRQSEA